MENSITIHHKIIVSVVKYLDRLVTEVWWSPSLGGIQNFTRRGPEQPALLDPALSRELDDMQRSLHTSVHTYCSVMCIHRIRELFSLEGTT